ncbi:MAG TPA: ABC transporter substrate-binding protein [Candidatus Elarobacter sp.]|jgi:branched-chain amino acid transport system substrate-binding protein
MRRSAFIARATATAASVAVPSRPTVTPTVRIGFLESFSGPFSAIGHHQHAGAELAIKAANSRGGVRHELVTGDDAGRPAEGSVAARALIDHAKVDAMMMGSSSAVALAVAPIVREAGVFTVLLGASAVSLTGTSANRVVYRFPPNDKMQLNAFAQRILSYGKNWYFIVADYTFGHDGHTRLAQLLQHARGTEVAADLVQLNAPDYSSSLLKLRNSNADVLVLCQGNRDARTAAKQFVELGLQTRFHLAGINLEDYDLQTLPVGSTFPVPWSPSVSDSARKLARELQPHLDDPISWRHYFGYISTAQLIDRMHAVGTTRTEPLVAAFQEHRFDAAKSHPAVWRACDHQCGQDQYVGVIVSDSKREKTGSGFDIVVNVPPVLDSRACLDADSAAAATTIVSQDIPERPGYQPKRV